MCSLISQAKESNLFLNVTREILFYANRDHRNKCTLQLQNLDLYVVHVLHPGCFTQWQNSDTCMIFQLHRYLKQSQTDVRKWRTVYIIL